MQIPRTPWNHPHTQVPWWGLGLCIYSPALGEAVPTEAKGVGHRVLSPRSTSLFPVSREAEGRQGSPKPSLGGEKRGWPWSTGACENLPPAPWHLRGSETEEGASSGLHILLRYSNS